MNTYYAAAQLDNFLRMVNEGTAYPSSPELEAYWKLDPDVPAEEVSSRFEESNAFRQENELDPIGSSDFASQISLGSAQDTFVRAVREVGVETEYVEDVFGETPDQEAIVPPIPGLSDVIHTLVRKGHAIDTDRLKELAPSIDVTPVSEPHIRETPPTVWGEEDSVIAGKLSRARRYVRLFLNGGQP